MVKIIKIKIIIAYSAQNNLLLIIVCGGSNSNGGGNFNDWVGVIAWSAENIYDMVPCDAMEGGHSFNGWVSFPFPIATSVTKRWEYKYDMKQQTPSFQCHHHKVGYN